MAQEQVSVKNKANEDPPTPPTYSEATAGGILSNSGGNPGDGETFTEFCWDDMNIRRIFIRKVYAILALQLSVTLAIVSLFTFCDPVRDFIQANPGWYWAAYIVFFVIYLTIAFWTTPRRKYPWNLILLAVFTLALSYLTGMVSSYYNTKSVVICLGITVLVCLAITIFSFQTKIDISSCLGMMSIFSIALFICALILLFLLLFGPIPWLETVFAALGAIAFCMFLAFDTQLLLGEKRYTISPEDYIFAVISIYLDIVFIFSFVLQLFGCRQD